MWCHPAKGWTSDINKMVHHHFLPKCPGCGQGCMTYTAADHQGGEHVIHFVKKCPYLRFHPHPALTGGCSCSPRWEEHIFSWSHTDGRWSSWHSSPGFWKVSWQRDKEKNTWKKNHYTHSTGCHIQSHWISTSCLAFSLFQWADLTPSSFLCIISHECSDVSLVLYSQNVS